jgi:hypothetical protein
VASVAEGFEPLNIEKGGDDKLVALLRWKRWSTKSLNKSYAPEKSGGLPNVAIPVRSAIMPACHPQAIESHPNDSKSTGAYAKKCAGKRSPLV